MLLGHVVLHSKSVRATFTQWGHRLLTLQEHTGAIRLGDWKTLWSARVSVPLSGQHPILCRYIIQEPYSRFQVFVVKKLKRCNTVRYFENEGTFK